jgi:hypothetical protein
MAEDRWYGLLAALARRAVPPLAQRIYSITYRHSGEEWTSTVGEALRGICTRQIGGGLKRRTRTLALSDSAITLAIFSGDPNAIVTNAFPGWIVRSAWANPFYVGAHAILRSERFACADQLASQPNMDLITHSTKHLEELRDRTRGTLERIALLPTSNTSMTRKRTSDGLSSKSPN